MTLLDIFLNRQDRLRSGWRFLIFGALYGVAASGISLAVFALVMLATHETAEGALRRLSGSAGYVFQFALLFLPAVALGWGCGRVLDGVPLRAQGWTTHRGWARDFIVGTLLGAFALTLAAVVATGLGGFHFGVGAPGLTRDFLKTFIGAAGVYVLLAAGEEALFRGYPLQTLMRSWPFVLAVLPSSVLFAYVHLTNPNLPGGYLRAIMFTNTALAGVWLAVGFWRTRSMWLPLGLHWAWNWTMGSLLGLPVSGITSLTRAPLLRATDRGPAWLTGGAYGLEGGLACTFVLVLATVFVWRTRLLRPAEELQRFTDDEQPKASVAGDTAAGLNA
jgi:membrane protease YdiL (CAAX protease family)